LKGRATLKLHRNIASIEMPLTENLHGSKVKSQGHARKGHFPVRLCMSLRLIEVIGDGRL